MSSPPRSHRVKTFCLQAVNDLLLANKMKIAGSNILTGKELEKMTNEQLIESAMKVQNNLMSKQIRRSEKRK